MIEMFIHHYIENYTGYKSDRWCYEDGCIYKGVADLYKATRYEWFCDQLIGYLNKQIQPDGKINGYDPSEYCLDDINAGKVLFLAYEKTSDVRYLIALRSLREQLRSHPRCRTDSFWHKKIYPFQIWLDGLYMALPFLAQFSLKFENGKSLPDIHRQFFNVRSLMFDGPKGLYYHGYDENQESRWADPNTGRSACFWSRAMGWYVMALVDLCELIDTSHEDYIFYARLLKEVTDSILPWQQSQGLWMQIMDQPDRQGNYVETSASAMFAYTLLKGRRLGILKDYHGQAGRNAFEGIVETQLQEKENDVWELKGICSMAGLGDGNGRFAYRDGSYDYYVNEPVVANDPKGVGAFMMARAEMLRLEDEK